MPNTRLDLMRPMASHLMSEVGHGEMALKDFIKLGGDEDWARARQMTPASYAMGATCRMLAERENPFGYLGYMYLFESVTPIMAERVQGFLQAKGFPVEAQRFIDEHAEVDIKHSDLMNKLVVKVVHDFPDAGADIAFAADCFAVVYPLPIWAAVMANVAAEIAGQPLPG
jgi:pyrroloquinoline quinone (PQQ) biosynthesis protein C